MDLKALQRLLRTILYNYVPQGHQHQFHQRKTINKYLRRNPKLDLAINLQKIMRNLTTTTEDKFTKKLDEWYEKHKDTLLEKSINSTTKKASYTHPKIVSAYGVPLEGIEV